MNLIQNHAYNPVCFIPKDNILKDDKALVLLSCALWSPNIYFQDFAEKTHIIYVDSIFNENFMEKYEVCG